MAVSATARYSEWWDGSGAKYPYGTATFSPDGKYRYTLTRDWARDGNGRLAVIGLNPSTADEVKDDPTVRRCIGFAKGWGFDGLIMLNLFAYRATDPKELLRVECPEGPGNLEAVRVNVRDASAVLAAWGASANRVIAACLAGYWTRFFAEIVDADVACLSRTKDGYPRHPLYVRGDTKPVPFLGDGGALCRVGAL